MPKQLNQNIKPASLIPIQTINATMSGSGVDTYLPDGSSFDTALIRAAIGILGSQATTKVKIEESNASDFGSGVSVAEGGEEVTVAADSVYSFQVKRLKRYLRATITLTTPGGSPSAVVHVSGILCNWDIPFPIL